MAHRVLLLTGAPGTGKTTIIKKAASEASSAGGFYTEDMREDERRVGFRLVTLSGPSAVFAHVKTRSPYRVSRYGVDASILDSVAVPALEEATMRCDLIVMDEIGKMELVSANFRRSVLAAMESGKRVLGTIMLAPNPWTDGIKARPEVCLIHVTRSNRDDVLKEVVQWVQGSGKP
ncbi:MAG: NTPase [Chloroflexi bacterium]|nr:NTPase [Chloroflexota bacterium]